jgi:RNA polymerase sigma-32 factor
MTLKTSMNSRKLGSSSSIALAMPSLPALGVGTLDAYLAHINRLPMLSAAQEFTLAQEYRRTENLDAARQLVLSHLRLVASVARQYLGYGIPHADLIQEGNIGLMKAVKRYDPNQGVRLVSYAIHWIKAEIHEYILKNWRLVKVATTKAQRKLFFNLRSNKLSANALTSAEIESLAKALDIRGADVKEMEIRLAGGEVSIEADERDEEQFAPIHWLADERQEPSAVLNQNDQFALQGPKLMQALNTLDGRSRAIVQARWLDIDANGQGSKTLHDLAKEYGISAERVRQIEVAAFKKLRIALKDDESLLH